jgi:hypothetical protein
LAFIGSFHKCNNLDRFFRRNRCEAPHEELGDLEAERIIAVPIFGQSLAGQRQLGLAGLAIATVFAGRTAAIAKPADLLVHDAKR